MENVYTEIDQRASHYIKKLADAVAIPSVSGTLSHRPDVVKMGKWLETELLALGCTVSMRDVGKQTLEGVEVGLPPVVLAQYGNDPNKTTVLVYGHYDVQPALLSDGWATDPWTLVEDKEGRMFGRGADLTDKRIYRR